ncbi:hypothetical protein [Aquimarina litoralis]|uniref:hypothetical protein n=1 Tax=Aquimarina litoralis TaxID=584605 RepID=UPI001C5724A3|nr:hypothetical protein [Aquimarina litoralis]MBW1298681.1 hypothetical protein [Aquimarina litoralis]
MKLFRLSVILMFSVIFGNNFCVAQKSNTNQPEQYLPHKVASSANQNRSFSKKAVNSKKNKRVAETGDVFSDKEKNARALTAKKSRQSGKGSLTKEQIKRRREARVAEIKEKNKKKKKVRRVQKKSIP